MMLLAFLCFLALVVSWIVAATPAATESAATTSLTLAPSAGD
jgi:hypothetical protein